MDAEANEELIAEGAINNGRVEGFANRSRRPLEALVVWNETRVPPGGENVTWLITWGTYSRPWGWHRSD